MAVAKVSYGIIFAAWCTSLVVSFSAGPPAEDSTCLNMRPGSSAPHLPQIGNGTYDLTIDNMGEAVNGYFMVNGGEVYTGTISSSGREAIRGFLVQAVDPSGTRIGNFGTANGRKHLTCSSVNSAIADEATLVHSSPNMEATVQFQWTAPSSAGMVDFRFTIVRSRTMYFGPLSAASPNGLIKETREVLPPEVTMPTRDPEDYRITARKPHDCTGSDCFVFVGVDTNAGNPEFLDIYLEGNAQGWVAIGFTATPSMFSADVIGCNLQDSTTNEVEALDTWNSNSGRDNSPNNINNAYLRNGSYIDGRLRCIINRRIVASNDPNNDLALNTSLYLLYGISNYQERDILRSHGVGLRHTPEVSQGRVNPATGMVNFSADRLRLSLTKLHGIFMWFSWPIYGLSGTFFAHFMRPSLPNGWWFHTHWLLMFLSLSNGAQGFLLIFIAQFRRQPNSGLINFNTNYHIAHFILGITAMVIHFINPLIAIFRCKPGAKHRWIFNVIHGYGIGNLAVILGLTTMGLGAIIYNGEVSRLRPTFNIFWLFVAYVVFYTVVVSIGYNIIFYVIFPRIFKDSRSSKKREKDVTYAQSDNSGSKNPRNEPSKDSKFRWIAFGIFCIFNVLFVIAMIVLILFY